MPYKQPKNTPMHNDGASEPITAGILAALKIGKIAVMGVKAAKAAKLAKLASTGIKVAKGAKGVKAGMTTLKAAKTLKAGKAAATAGKAAKATRLTSKAGKLATKAGKLTVKNAEKVAKGPTKIGKLASKVGDKVNKVKEKVDKGFEKLESATGGELGNAAELKSKAGDQLKTTAIQGLQKGIGNKRQEEQESSDRLSRAVSGQVESLRSNGNSGGGGYSNPGGASAYAAPIVARSGGGTSPQNILKNEDDKEDIDSLAPSNMNTLQQTGPLPEQLDVKGFSIPIAGMSRLTKSLKSNINKKYDKSRKTLVNPDTPSNAKLKQSAAEFAKSASNKKIMQKLDNENKMENLKG